MVEQPGVEVALGRPVVGPGVGVAAVGDGVGEQAVERLGVAELVLGERADRDVLLEDRADPRPLGIAEPDDELVVGHAEQEDRERPLAAVAGAAEVHRERLEGPIDPAGRHFAPLLAFGFAWPLTSRAAASLSRIT